MSLLPAPDSGPFRIRANDGEDPDYEAKDQAYRRHLRSLRLPRNSDLLRFFGWDFFHDGSIEGLGFSESGQDLSFHIEAPNIRLKDTVHYLPAMGFTCRFSGVAHFHMSTLRYDRINDPLAAHETYMEFAYAEVDSLEAELKELRATYRRRFHSLVIGTMPCRRDLVILFRDLQVEADEPATFEAILRDPAYQMPMWNRPGPI